MARRQDAEETLAARIAAIGGKTEEALGKQERTVLDAIPWQPLEIEISTARAMRKTQKRPGDARRKEALITRVAAPRTKPGGPCEMIEQTTATRAKAVRATASWTNHA